MKTSIKNSICTFFLLSIFSFGFGQTTSTDDLKSIKNIEVKTQTIDNKGNIEIDLGTELMWNVVLYNNQSDIVHVMPYSNGKVTMTDIEPGIYELEIISENGSGTRYQGLELKMPELD